MRQANPQAPKSEILKQAQLGPAEVIGVRAVRSYFCSARSIATWTSHATIGRCRQRMKEIAEPRVRYGCARIHILLQREGWRNNHKRT